MALIRNREVVDHDPWINIVDDETVPHDADVIVSLTRWQRDHVGLVQRTGRSGVRVGSGDELDGLIQHLSDISLVALEFPSFKDGRGYSKARLLRERYHFQGELRAVGNVLPDQLFYMARCGINAFEVQAGKSLDQALAAFGEYTVTYQAAADDPRPLYRRTDRG